MEAIYGYDPQALGLRLGKYSNKNSCHVYCPFHGGSGKSATFNIATGGFYCFSCGVKANVNKVAKVCGGKVVKKLIKVKTEDDLDNWEFLLQNEVNVGNNYLLNRLVSPQQILKYEIRETDKGIAIPTKDENGIPVGVVIRQESNYIRYLYGGKRVSCWPEDKLKTYNPNELLIVTEGIFGALRGQLYGHNTVATLGAMVKKDITQYIKHFSKIIVVFDPDSAGYLGAIRLLKFVPQAKILVPGISVDEVGEDIWAMIARGANCTRDTHLLEKLVTDKKMFNRFGR